MGTLSVPTDCYELMYRLGQQSIMFKQIKVEYYAPYLLKEGLVQKVTKFGDTSEEPILHSKSFVGFLLCPNFKKIFW